MTFLPAEVLKKLRSRMDKWTRTSGATSFTAFGGFSGQMFLNQIVKASPDGEAEALLRTTLVTPEDEQAAAEAIDGTVAFCEKVKEGGYPAPGHAPFMVTFFWGLADLEEWPIAWVSAVKCLKQIGWFVASGSHGVDYLEFRNIVRSLGSPRDVLRACAWWVDHPFVGLDPAMNERLKLAADADARRTPDGTYANHLDANLVETQARSVLGDLSLLGSGVEQRVAEALTRSVKSETPAISWSPGRFRADGWVKWSVDRIPGKPSLRVCGDA